MRTVDQWFAEYQRSHSHPSNKRLHWICVPLIVLTVVGALWSIPVPAVMAEQSPWLNWATLIAALAVVYYAVLSPALAVGAAVIFVAMFAIVSWLDSLPWPLWATCLVVFIVAWIGQFIGHAIEGRKPSFMEDIQFLMIGPLWLLGFVYRAVGIRYS